MGPALLGEQSIEERRDRDQREMGSESFATATGLGTCPQGWSSFSDKL